MIRMTSEDIHAVELTLLDHLHAQCEEMDLTYYLAYGTLLGAIRHGGFIPWDDDADVLMPREDYDRLIAEYEDNDDYLLVKPFDREYGFAWAKLVDRRTTYENRVFLMPESYGLSLDIFPLDSDGGPFWFKLSQRMSYLRRRKWKALNPSENSSPLKKAAKQCIKKLTPEFLVDERGFDFVRGQNPSSDRCVNYASPYAYARESKPWEWFGEGRLAPFEGDHQYRIPDEPERILAVVYGEDWRTPVVTTHSDATVYWR